MLSEAVLVLVIVIDTIRRGRFGAAFPRGESVGSRFSLAFAADRVFHSGHRQINVAHLLVENDSAIRVRSLFDYDYEHRFAEHEQRSSRALNPSLVLTLTDTSSAALWVDGRMREWQITARPGLRTREDVRTPPLSTQFYQMDIQQLKKIAVGKPEQEFQILGLSRTENPVRVWQGF